MSAICGLFYLDGRPPTREALAIMSAALAHRGPDDSRVWLDDDAAVGHRMRYTTPESHGEIQPLLCRSRTLVLVADARIDNREELLAQLGMGNARRSDSEIIAASYEKWGHRCVDWLIGDFAFALWNTRDRQFFCARDPMGVKPFYYLHTDRLFAFASEIKALLTLPGVQARVDEEQLALFLGCRQSDPSRTVFRGLSRLPAGHTLLASRAGLQLHRFWNPESAPDVRFASDVEYAEAFRDCFRTAVAARLRSAHPIGATLSGGLDSSAIVCTARRLQGAGSSPLHTLSVVFRDLPEKELRLIDERSFMDAVLREGGVQPHFVHGDELSPLRDIQRVLWHLDEPHGAPNLYLHWAIFERASKAGVRVVLDGFDGDTAVSHGFGRLAGLTQRGEFDVLQREIRAFGSSHRRGARDVLSAYVLPALDELSRRGRFLTWMRTAIQLSRRFGISRTELLIERGIRPLLPMRLQHVARGLREDWSPASRLLLPPFAAMLRRESFRGEEFHGLRSERETHIEGITNPLYQSTLEIADKAANAFGIEPRYPFFDRRVIEFCLGLPDEQKFADGWPRLHLRRAMAGVLPPEVQWRTMKANLSPNFHHRFRTVDLANMSADDERNLSPYVRIDRVRALSRQVASSGREESRQEALALFRVYVLSEWLRQLAGGNHRAQSALGSPYPVVAA